MCLNLIVLAVLFAMHQGGAPVYNSSVRPVADLCNFAKVKNLKQGHYLSVRSGPGVKYRKVDRLKPGAEVYICDERGGWLQIFYSSTSEGPCGKTHGDGLDPRKTTGCQSGWVNQKWIDVISG
jgi:Bacterial SH3 domain